MQVTEDEFRDAIAEIRHLSPKPANGYSDGGSDAAPYVGAAFDPGLITTAVSNCRSTPARLPELCGSTAGTLEMMRAHGVVRRPRARRRTARRCSSSKNKIDSAKWFISAIKQRRDTLMRTMQEILDFQQEYFKTGDQSKLRPMILKDIADRTGLDVSTISRVVNSKYVQTQFGIILLKSLFSEAMQTASGGEVSSYEIKNILRSCIDDEDKRRPLTDETLMDILNDKGYCIARRTVAKYREMLGIPVARLRKQI